MAQALGITRQTVALWQERFVEPGIAGVEKEAPRSGRPRTILSAADRRDPPQDHSGASSHRYPLEHPHAGTGQAGELLHGGADLAGARSEAARGEDI
jgi:hypothetical protein